MTDQLKSGERLPDIPVPQLDGSEFCLGALRQSRLADGLLHVVDISIAVFDQPELAGLAKERKFIRDNDSNPQSPGGLEIVAPFNFYCSPHCGAVNTPVSG